MPREVGEREERLATFSHARDHRDVAGGHVQVRHEHRKKKQWRDRGEQRQLHAPFALPRDERRPDPWQDIQHRLRSRAREQKRNSETQVHHAAALVARRPGIRERREHEAAEERDVEHVVSATGHVLREQRECREKTDGDVAREPSTERFRQQVCHQQHERREQRVEDEQIRRRDTRETSSIRLASNGKRYGRVMA